MNNRTLPFKKILLTALIASGLSSCSSSPPKDARLMDEMATILEQGADTSDKATQQTTPVPEAVSEALLPPMTAGVVEQVVEEDPRFDISVNNSPAQEFFMGLVEGTSYNMIVHPAVSGKITLNLKNVTIPEVMDVIRDVYGFEFQRTRSGYQVLQAGLRSKIFQLNYLNLQRVGKSSTRVSSGQVSEGARTDTSDTGTSTTQRGEGSLSGSEINTESQTDLWSELNSILKSMVGTEGGRSVVVSPQSGVIIVRAMPNELRAIEDFIDTMQDIIQRQVIIEAKILEVELKDGFQSGINWSALAREGTKKSLLFGQTGGGTSIGTSGAGTTGIRGNTGVLDPSSISQVSGTNTSAFGGVFSMALTLNDFTAFIELLGTQGNVQVLSSPRVSTLNNQKAVIKVGTDEFFVTDISSTTTTGTATTTTPDITLTPFFSGIALDVTPQINQQGEVILHIRPSVSEVSDQTKEITVAGQTQSLPLAFSSVRESDSIIRASSGQLVVIGGLMKNRRSNDVASVPGLGDVPLVGGLFKHTRESVLKNELVILLRPIVIDSDRTWSASLREAAKSFRSAKSYHMSK